MSEGKFQENKDWNRTYRKVHNIEFVVRGQVPRKQGLKLSISNIAKAECLCPRASSKKTRIETIFR